MSAPSSSSSDNPDVAALTEFLKPSEQLSLLLLYSGRIDRCLETLTAINQRLKDEKANIQGSIESYSTMPDVMMNVVPELLGYIDDSMRDIISEYIDGPYKRPIDIIEFLSYCEKIGKYTEPKTEKSEAMLVQLGLLEKLFMPYQYRMTNPWVIEWINDWVSGAFNRSVLQNKLWVYDINSFPYCAHMNSR